MYKTIQNCGIVNKRGFIKSAMHHGFSHESLVKIWFDKLIEIELDDLRDKKMKVEFEKVAKQLFARVIANYMKFLELEEK